MKVHSLAELKVPSHINSLQKRLAWYIRQTILSMHECNASRGTPEYSEIRARNLGLRDERANVHSEARETAVVHGPPDWVVDKNVHLQNDQVVWPAGLENAAAEARLQFLLRLQRLIENDFDNLDVVEKIGEATLELQSDSRWD